MLEKRNYEEQIIGKKISSKTFSNAKKRISIL